MRRGLRVLISLASTHLSFSARPFESIESVFVQLSRYMGGELIYQQPALERCDSLGRDEDVLPPADSMSAVAEVAGMGCWPRGARGGS